MSDDRFTPEQQAIDEAATKATPPKRVSADPPLLTPCRRYIDQPSITPEEIEKFIAEELETP